MQSKPKESSLKGKILFVFSDPGGAKPILSLIEEKNIDTCLAVSNRSYSFYDDFKTPVKILENNFEEIVNSYKPDLIFTGTSYPSDFDKQFLKIALEKNIECYTFVDHWTNMNLRFSYEHIFLEPSQVWVIDERAKEIAMKAGIPEDKIVISGNPYHRWLKNWKPKIDKASYLNSINLHDDSTKLVLYAPDPLSNIDGNSIYNFDEIIATEELVEAIISNKSVFKNWKILVKAHPNQEIEKLKIILKYPDKFILLPNDIDTNTSIFFADVVIGFFSSLLIESDILNKKIIRFLHLNIKNDPISELNIGETIYFLPKENQHNFVNKFTTF